MGEKDPVATVPRGRFLHERIENSEYLLLEDGGHYIPIQNHDFFNKAFIEFIEKSATKTDASSRRAT